MASKIRPLQDRVIVKRLKEEEKTKGGLYIPDTAKEKPVEGTVLAVGNGKVLEDGTVRRLDVKEGDRVLFGKYSGTEVKIDGEEHLILREDDILGVLLERGHQIRAFEEHDHTLFPRFAFLEQRDGTPLDTRRLNRDLLRAYGDGWYESVDYALLTERDRNILRVLPVEKSWGPDYLRFGMNLYADSNQGSSFGVRLGYHKTWLKP
mgnify:CR=1 FL=1